jgi:large subunit ribosomal protein L22
MTSRAKKRKNEREATPKGLPVGASLASLRTSPFKVRLVANEVRGKRVEDALTYLWFSKKRAARPLYKLIESAVSNAENYATDVDELVISELIVDGGRTLRRFRPRAQGRATTILKRTCSITVKLDQASNIAEKKQAKKTAKQQG